MARRDFDNTSPFYIHESRPMPLPACGTAACRQGRGAPCRTGCAEVLSAQAAGARMAMGDQAPSAPVPLAPRRMTPEEVGEACGNVIGWPLGVLAAVATVAAVAAVLRTAMF